MADERKEEGKPDATPAEPPKEEAEAVDVEALKTKARERDEFLDLARRTAAEFSNYRKRVDRERAEWTDRVVGEFVLSLLPALDDLDRALAQAEAAGDAATLVEGFGLVRGKLLGILKANGIESFEPAGVPFDPAEHDAVIVEETDELPHHHVMEVVQKGYRLRGRVLRAAQVKVARNKPKDAETPQTPANETPENAGKEGSSDDADV